jgi:hypothetical protein
MRDVYVIGHFGLRLAWGEVSASGVLEVRILFGCTPHECGTWPGLLSNILAFGTSEFGYSIW